MATSMTVGDGGDKINKRASYFEMLSNISSELDFMLKDLKKNETFTPTSPRSPLHAANSNVTFETKDRNLQRNTNQLTSEPTYQTTDEHLKLQLPAKVSSKQTASTSPLSPVPPSPCTPTSSTSLPMPTTTGQNFFSGTSSTTSTISTTSSPSTTNLGSWMGEFGSSMEDNSLTMMTRLVHTKPIWFLPTTQRAAAAHYLQGQAVGTFVVRQARQKDKLSLTLKHPGTGKGPYIESYPIDSTLQGVKLSTDDMVFPAVDELIAYHVHTEGGLPCRLALPMAVMAARNLREIQSLAVLEEDFWKSAHSKSPSLPTKQDSFNLDPSLLGVKQEPSYHKPSLNQTLSEGASSRTKPTDPASMPPVDFSEDRLTSGPPTCGVYGIITGPPVIYENADDKFNPRRPRSLDSLTRYSWSEKRSSRGVNLTPSRLSIHRPPSEFDRQDMRFSSASEFDFVTSLTEQRYPPPRCAPPPPPPGEESSGVFMMPSVPGQYTWSLVKPTTEAVEYSQPYDQPPLPPKQRKSFSTYGKPTPVQPQHSAPAGYGGSVPGSQTGNAYRAPQPAVSSLNNWQQQQQQPVANYSAPPPPARSGQASLAADSQQQRPTAPPRAKYQMQNILQPPTTCSSSTAVSSEPAAWTALPEFDPLFAATSDYRQPQTNANISARNSPPSDSLMRDYILRDLQYGIKAVTLSDTYSSPSINNNGKPSKMAPLSSLAERTACDVKVSQLIKVHDDDECIQEETISDHEMDEIPDNEGNLTRSLDNSSESDCEVNSPTSFPVGIPFTENQNGNHLVLSQSVELSGRTEESEFEQSREGEKKEYKRNKSSILGFSKIKGLTKRTRSGHKKTGRKSKKKKDPSADIQEAILRIAANDSIGLGALVHGFIRTQEEKCETDKPDIVLRSVRQFMSGTKNYLLNKREPEIDVVIDKYINELDLASLEAIVEGALHQCVLGPLKSDIGMSCLNEYNRNGSMALMDRNIMQAKTKSPEELGIKPNYIPPQGEYLEDIRRLFSELQEACSPLKKLDLLLKIVSAIYNSVRNKNTGREVTHSMGADDFLPMLIYVLVQCEMMSIEIEADYMWGLLDPSMLSGEGGYYLTTLSSAICVLKQFEEENDRETQGFLTVLAAVNQDRTCISLKTLPVLPGMMANEVCRILAHRMSLSDAEAEHYRLYLLQEAGESLVEDYECPLKVKNDEEANGVRGCRFGFRSRNAAVNWPKTSGTV